MTLSLAVVWIHVVSMAVWVGGLVYQSHVVLPAARRGEPRPFVTTARAARPVTWTAVALVVLTGFYNVTRLGPQERVIQSGVALLLAAKFILVVAAIALAGQRDFTLIPRLARMDDANGVRATLRTIGMLDHVVLLLLVVIVYLGLSISRIP